MWIDAYDIGPIRPPSEANSLLIRVNRNCPWNRCAFCTVYKGERFERKSVAEVMGDIDKAAAFFGARAGDIRTAFLQDANAMLMKTPDLVRILEYLKSKFPGMERVTTYGRASTVARKTVQELEQLHRAGLSRLHMGLESGSPAMLAFMDKGTTQAQLIEAGRRVKQAHISLSYYVMPGLGGMERWQEHAQETARVINAVNPDFIRLRSLSVRRDSPLGHKALGGEFTAPGDVDMVREIRLMIEHIQGVASTLVSDHMLNLLQELEGRFPDDKPALLERCDRFLALPPEEQEHFTVGARTRLYYSLSDMDNPALRARVSQMQQSIRHAIDTDPDCAGLDCEGYIRRMMQDVI
jgi:radical SAM superfamily enzyme